MAPRQRLEHHPSGRKARPDAEKVVSARNRRGGVATLDLPTELAVRHAAFRWLDEHTGFGQSFHLFTGHELRTGFQFNGTTIPLVGAQQGIWKPRALAAALSIRTVYTPPGISPPYHDSLGEDGWFRYKYRGTNPQHSDNRALRVAMEYELPLIWFWGVGLNPSLYQSIKPVWLRAEEPDSHEFVVAVDEAQRFLPIGLSSTEVQRQYTLRLTKQRVHQPVFRAQVIAAYSGQCAVCRLRYTSLLDAAHIVRDGHPRGDPVVPNGLALCKIHHAAFDQNFIGIRPDTLSVEVRPDVRNERDGPMLLHGLQEMQGIHLHVPTVRRAHPDRSRLEDRWNEFRRAG